MGPTPNLPSTQQSRRHHQPKTIHFFMGIDDADHVGKRHSAQNGEKPPKHQL